MKRILVTGGAGFIGSHLCTRLIEEGNIVICLDNFFTGSKENISYLIGHPRFELIEHDIINPFWTDVDEIYNLACPASPIHYQHDAIKTAKTAVFGTFNMLGLAKRNKAKILQASTSEVYGDPLSHPQREGDWGNVNPIGYRSCYDEGKRCAETLCMDYYRQHGVLVKIIRIFNTYGPNMLTDDGRVISNFVVQALLDKDITIYGDGKQTRSFQYIDDLVEGMIRMMATEDHFTGPVNIGNPCEFSIFELAQKILELTCSHSNIIFEPLPHDDPRQRRPDITLAKEKLDWEPHIHLEEGLMKVIDYFKSVLHTGFHGIVFRFLPGTRPCYYIKILQSGSTFAQTETTSFMMSSNLSSSASTVIFCVMKLTFASLTPGIFLIASSIFAAQFAQSRSSNLNFFFMRYVLLIFYSDTCELLRLHLKPWRLI